MDSLFLEMLSSMPTAAMNIIREVPPALIKGSVCPVGGTELVATPMFTATCSAITLVMPAARRLPNLSLQIHQSKLRTKITIIATRTH